MKFYNNICCKGQIQSQNIIWSFYVYDIKLQYDISAFCGFLIAFPVARNLRRFLVKIKFQNQDVEYFSRLTPYVWTKRRENFDFQRTCVQPF